MPTASKAPAPSLRVKVFSPMQMFYQGPARSVSAVNAAGTFDILPSHINFFSVLVGGNVVVNTGGERVEIPISHGIVHVREDQVTLFVFGTASTDEDDDEDVTASR